VEHGVEVVAVITAELEAGQALGVRACSLLFGIHHLDLQLLYRGAKVAGLWDYQIQIILGLLTRIPNEAVFALVSIVSMLYIAHVTTVDVIQKSHHFADVDAPRTSISM
jgi:hypothetical protein